MIQSIIINICTALLGLIGVPFLFIVLLSTLGHTAKRSLAAKFGINSQLYFGFFGILIHETSHLLFAIIFAHKIKSFRLIKFPNTSDQSLGFVNHTWNSRNFYQSMGNFFIGISPVIGCCFATFLLTRVTLPDIFQQVVNLAQNPGNFTLQFLSPVNWKAFLVFLIISANICIGGFDLSSADFNNSKSGLWQTVIFVTVCALLLSFTPIVSQFKAILISTGVFVTVICSFNFLLLILVNAIIKII